MNSKKLYLAAFAVATSATLPATLQAAVPEVSNVEMTQDNSRLVTINYTLADASAVVTLDVQTNANTSAAANDAGWTSIGGEALWNAKGDVWKKVAPGSRTITWRPDLSWPDHQIADGGARAVVTAWALDNTPDYMAVDVSAAAKPDTQTYYPSADFVPGGVSSSLYKTTTLLMRKIMAKDVKWTMGSTSIETKRNAAREGTHQVTLENNYYIGVYEITQAQWGEVATNSASTGFYAVEPAMRPMENVSYNEIRNTHNTSAGAGSVAAGTLSANPSDGSFLGLLRLKTGLDFDLPSEAQWEFAARAGKGVGYWGDGSEVLNENTDNNMAKIGRYQYNGGRGSSGNYNGDAKWGPEYGTAIVGRYLPNAWGIYDMHGNVYECCLDWYADDIKSYDGAVNISSSAPAKTLANVNGTNRVRRGGAWDCNAQYTRSASRSYVNPNSRDNTMGLRVVCTAGLE